MDMVQGRGETHAAFVARMLEQYERPPTALLRSRMAAAMRSHGEARGLTGQQAWEWWCAEGREAFSEGLVTAAAR